MQTAAERPAGVSHTAGGQRQVWVGGSSIGLMGSFLLAMSCNSYNTGDETERVIGCEANSSDQRTCHLRSPYSVARYDNYFCHHFYHLSSYVLASLWPCKAELLICDSTMGAKSH
uniref:Uncharacterized protein n=1 Tax=Knipowitschia caucasica TaxID=637954 RepID=A0AAV2LG02_KNICA